MARKKYSGLDDYQIELEKSAQAHAEVEWFLDKLGQNHSTFKVASLIEKEYGKEMLVKISEKRIKTLPKIKDSDEYNKLSPEEITDLLKERTFTKLIPLDELIGGLVQQVDYPEVRSFLRKSNLFKTISEMFEDKKKKE